MIRTRWIHLLLLAGITSLWFCGSPKLAVNSNVSETEKSLPNSLLWKIEGKDIHPSYIFGTIHMIDEDDYFFTKTMQSAFVDADGLALEFNLEDAMDMGAQIGMLSKAFMRNDTTLKDLLTEEEYKIVQDHFSKMGIPFFLFERVKPMFLTIFASEDMFSGMGFNMDGVKSYELELVDMAKASKMPISGLETMEYQLSIFDSIPYGAQADMLMASLTEDDAMASSHMDTLIHYYKTQNLQKLDELINADGTTATYRDILLDNRNRNWIPVIAELIAQQPMFIAVGAGHLAGEAGVLQLLKQEGFQVTPIHNRDGTN